MLGKRTKRTEDEADYDDEDEFSPRNYQIVAAMHAPKRQRSTAGCCFAAHITGSVAARMFAWRNAQDYKLFAEFACGQKVFLNVHPHTAYIVDMVTDFLRGLVAIMVRTEAGTLHRFEMVVYAPGNHLNKRPDQSYNMLVPDRWIRCVEWKVYLDAKCIPALRCQLLRERAHLPVQWACAGVRLPKRHNQDSPLRRFHETSMSDFNNLSRVIFDFCGELSSYKP
jgi:hypothetical protein